MQAAATGFVCDKCDGLHRTDDCPWFKKAREDHPDSRRPRNILEHSVGPVEVVRSARVIRQPGDGSCLFHSLSHGLRDGSTASNLRKQLVTFIRGNESLVICDSPLSDWIKWDTGLSVPEYAQRMADESQWGGGIEMAVVSHMKQASVHVFERDRESGGHKRISTFQGGSGKKVIRICYQGGVHYDALELASVSPPAFTPRASSSSVKPYVAGSSLTPMARSSPLSASYSGMGGAYSGMRGLATAP